jgi:NADPH:quinone reductase
MSVRAVTIVGGSLEWVERPEPVPGPSQLVVAVRAAGINAADLWQRRGSYAAPGGRVPPDVPGLEFAGEVVGLGLGTSRFDVGDRVMALVGGGAQAEVALTDEATALALPDGLSWEEGAGFMEAYATAHDALFTQCGLRPGERVLVTGAAGGVGTAAVQLASALGAEVIASARNAGSHRQLLELGAHSAVLPEDAAASGPYDTVLELVAGPSLSMSLTALASGGRISVIGIGAGARVEVDLLVLMARRGRIHGSMLRSRTLLERGSVVALLGEVALPLLAAGRLAVPVAGVLAMADAEAAYDRFAAGGKFGKLVLVPPAG